ncbi:MAG TPA: hydroxymethylbilane synthase [Flavipsychrobacter sp.]|nr:hydroxymethylbilane synthase [Flavipsychrobacter sp.]
MNKVIKIGTRESQLAVWQATQVKHLLEQHGYEPELVFIKSEGDADLVTPLYEIGVQGIFTRALDIALLNDQIDIAVHSMKDVPTQMAKGIIQAAVLPRASYKDLLVPKGDTAFLDDINSTAIIATSSIRRKAQWLHRFPHHQIENLRGNVNTRLRKINENNWNGAIFAAAGLERIELRPKNAVELDWMLPAPAQGAIIVVCKESDTYSFEACQPFHDEDTAFCTAIERDFLRVLLGGCSTPISALATIDGEQLYFNGNILSLDGRKKVEVDKWVPALNAKNLGKIAGEELLKNGGEEIMESIRNAQN